MRRPLATLCAVLLLFLAVGPISSASVPEPIDPPAALREADSRAGPEVAVGVLAAPPEWRWSFASSPSVTYSVLHSPQRSVSLDVDPAATGTMVTGVGISFRYAQEVVVEKSVTQVLNDDSSPEPVRSLVLSRTLAEVRPVYQQIVVFQTAYLDGPEGVASSLRVEVAAEPPASPPATVPPPDPAESASRPPVHSLPIEEAFLVTFTGDGKVRYVALEVVRPIDPGPLVVADVAPRGRSGGGRSDPVSARSNAPATGSVTVWLVALALLLATAGVAAVGVGLFSRFDRDDVLDHPRRAQIYEAVRAEPGIPFGRLRERLGLVPGVAQHHIGLLVQHGVLSPVRTGRVTRLYLAGPRPPPPPLEGTQARVVEVLRKSPGQSIRELAGQLALTEQSVWEQVLRLRTHGILVCEDARPRRWRLAA